MKNIVKILPILTLCLLSGCGEKQHSLTVAYDRQPVNFAYKGWVWNTDSLDLIKTFDMNRLEKAELNCTVEINPNLFTEKFVSFFDSRLFLTVMGTSTVKLYDMETNNPVTPQEFQQSMCTIWSDMEYQTISNTPTTAW